MEFISQKKPYRHRTLTYVPNAVSLKEVTKWTVVIVDNRIIRYVLAVKEVTKWTVVIVDNRIIRYVLAVILFKLRLKSYHTPPPRQSFFS